MRRVSIIIPSLNQAQFIGHALRSIFAQKWPVEVIVIDGGSSDGTIKILREYESRLSYWVSEPDRGQSHAINKGLSRVASEIWMYLNSDDFLTPGALSKAAAAFENSDVDWVSGAAFVVDARGQCTGKITPEAPEQLKDYLAPWSRQGGYPFPFSGACLMRRKVYEEIGEFDESLHFSMDMEYYNRALFVGKFKQTIIKDVLACWQIHDRTKTSRRGTAYGFRKDELEIARRYINFLPARERGELMHEMIAQDRMLPVREAMWLIESGHRRRALSLAVSAFSRAPSLITSRPWLGAVRRAIMGW